MTKRTIDDRDGEPVEIEIDEQFEYSYGWDIGAPASAVTRMQCRGRFWFDKQWEADVKTESFEFTDGSNMTVRYTANNKNFVDLTDYRPLARFLRWVLRRQKG